MNPTASSQEIQSRLGAVRSRIRRVQLTRGIAVVGTIGLAGLMVIMAADYLLAPLPVVARWALFVGWLIAVVFAAKFGFAPLFRKIGLIQIARWLEGRHPEIEERLSTVLELSHEGSNVSPGFLEALATAAEKDIGSVDPFSEVRSAQTRKRWGRPAIALLAILALSLAIWPSEASRLLVRAVAPFSDLGNVGAASFTILPGDLEAIEGDRIEIQIHYSGTADRIDFWMERNDASRFSQPLTRDGDGHFRYLLDPARQSFRYRVRSGRDESDAHTATVWPLPEILKPEVILAYPEYTRSPELRAPLGRGIEAVTGTHVTLTGATNTAIEAAWLEIGGQRIADARVEPSATGGRVSFSWTMDPSHSGEAVATLRHRLGREVEALRFPVEAVEDKPPLVLLISPSQRELRVRPDEVFQMRYEVTEDFAVDTLAFEVEAGEMKALPQDLPLAVRGSRPQRFRGSGEVVVGSLRTMFNGANDLRIRVRATDARPAELGGPGTGFSEWVRLQIDQSAESFVRQELRQEQDGARDTIEQAIRDVRDAKNMMDRRRDEMQKPQVGPDARKDLDQAAEKLAAAEQALNELAPRMEESVHAAKADSVEQAAEQLAESRENLENAPLQDTAEQRQEKLAEASKAAEDAIKALEQVRQKIDEDRQRVQDLARVQELAQQQRELARQAEENLTQIAADQPTPADWQQRQREMENALRQQLQERPDARAEALQAQAEQAKALADEARAMAESQQDFQEQSQQLAAINQPAGSDEALREAIAQEQAAIAAAANAQLEQAREEDNNLAGSLPDAAAAAEQAQAQIASGEAQAAAESAQNAAAAMKEAAAQADADAPAEAAQAEALNDLAARQENLAEAMEALAKGDPAAAQQALQEARSQAFEDALRGALAEAQADIAAETQAQLAQAQEERNNLADSLPEAAAATAETQSQMAAGHDQAAAEAAQAAANSMREAAAQADASSPAEAAQAESLAALAERQDQVAQALEALANSDPAAAFQAMQEAGAEAAAELAQAIQTMPAVTPSGALNEAAQNAAQGTEKAQAAAAQGQQGEQQQAASQHEQAGQNFERAAAALDRAAEEFAQAAQQAAAQATDPNKAPVSPADMAEAFQQAAEAAANPQPASAAMQAAAAAQALSQAAQAGRAQMQGLQPGMPMPGVPGMPGAQPGEDVSDDPNRPAQASPGLPPELARLGISASDWEKIQATLSSDVGAGGADGIPEEYRGLVKGYFESMSKTTNP
jgi:hypothetical protein